MERAVVTVDVSQKKYQIDMELPVKMPIGVLSGRILEVLKMRDEDLFQDVSQIQLIYQNKALYEKASLAEYGLWDGSILTAQIL